MKIYVDSKLLYAEKVKSITTSWNQVYVLYKTADGGYHMTECDGDEKHTTPVYETYAQVGTEEEIEAEAIKRFDETMAYMEKSQNE